MAIKNIPPIPTVFSYGDHPIHNRGYPRFDGVENRLYHDPFKPVYRSDYDKDDVFPYYHYPEEYGGEDRDKEIIEEFLQASASIPEKVNEDEKVNDDNNLKHRFDMAKAFASGLIPPSKSTDVDWPLLSFIYFTNLAAESSKPGATMIGAAGEAAKTPLAYLMKQREQKDTRPKEVRDLAVKVALSDFNLKQDFKPRTVFRNGSSVKVFTEKEYWELLGKGWGPEKPAKPVKPSKDKGDILKYMSLDDANKFVHSPTGFNLPENFRDTEQGLKLIESYVRKIVAPDLVDENNEKSNVIDTALIGRNIISGNNYLKFERIVDADGNVTGINFVTTEGTEAHEIARRRQKSELLFKEQIETSAKVHGPGQRVDGMLTAFFDHIKKRSTVDKEGRSWWDQIWDKEKHLTGPLQDKLLEVRKLMSDTLNIGYSDKLNIQDDIKSLSNYLASFMRISGAGSTSDMEFKAYMAAALAMSKTTRGNYVTLYALKKMWDNGLKRNLDYQEILHGKRGLYMSPQAIHHKLNQSDPGIFYKYKPTSTEAAKTTDEREKWLGTIPDGEIILNRFISEGKQFKMLEGGRNYLIKGVDIFSD